MQVQTSCEGFDKVRVFMSDFFIPVLSRKILLLLFVYLLVISMKQPLSENIILKFFLFFFGYLSVYFINDMIDLKTDLTDPDNRKEKLLARGILSFKEYTVLTVVSFLFGIGLFLLSPVLGVLLLILILINVIRSLVKIVGIRDVFLLIIQFVSQYLLWYLITDGFPPAVVLPMFFGYSFIYSYLHYLYKIRIIPFERFIDARIFISLFILFITGVFLIPLMNLTAYPILVSAVSGSAVGIFSLYLLLFGRKYNIPKITFLSVNMLSLIILFSVLTATVFPEVVAVKVNPPVPANLTDEIHHTLDEVDKLQTELEKKVVSNLTDNLTSNIPTVPNVLDVTRRTTQQTFCYSFRLPYPCQDY
ncbi:hypothetical protein J7K41_00320 [Candidatus Micrarchaeota archaeon]|nr:hypothetical protein [Candidatus Micrarchaeota archaeon]